MSPVRESPRAEQRRWAVRLGERLKAARERYGYSQAELARLTGVSRPRLWEYERGRVLPQLASLEKLLRELSVSFEDVTS